MITLGEFRDMLNAVIDDYGAEKELYVPRDPDAEVLEFFPAELFFLTREDEDIDGNIVSNVAIAVYGTENP